MFTVCKITIDISLELYNQRYIQGVNHKEVHEEYDYGLMVQIVVRDALLLALVIPRSLV